MSMAGLWIDRRDDPVLGHAPDDAKGGVIALFYVLTDDGGEQGGGQGDLRTELCGIEEQETGVGVFAPAVDEGLTSSLVVPVDHGLGRTGIVVATAQHGPQCCDEFGVGHFEHSADGRADEGDGVHCRHRVIKRSRVEHPAATDEPGLFGCVTRRVEDAVGSNGAPQAFAHVNQDGVGEARPPGAVIAPDARRVTPAVVKAVALSRLAVREPFEALEHHDHGNNTRRYRAPTLVIEEIGDGLVGEQLIALAVQEGVDRVLVERLVAEPRHVVEQIALLVGLTECHWLLRVDNYSVVILPDLALVRESNLRGLSVRDHAKDTTHLGGWCLSPNRPGHLSEMGSFASSEMEIVAYGRSCAEAIFGTPSSHLFNTSHLDRSENPADMLDLSYEKMLEQLTQVLRAPADM